MATPNKLLELRREVVAASKRRRNPELRAKAKQPIAEERAFVADTNRLVRAWRTASIEAVNETLAAWKEDSRKDARRMDANEATSKKLIDALASTYRRTITIDRIKNISNENLSAVKELRREEWGKQIREVIGMPWPGDESPELAKLYKNQISECVGLIHDNLSKSADMRRLVLLAQKEGWSSNRLRRAIMNRFGVSRSRGELIARDQTLKFNGRYTRRQHEDVGLDSYKWGAVMDERTRGNPSGLWPKGNHWQLNGRVFTYKNPPLVAKGRRCHPGDDFQCRCMQEPVFRF